MSVNDYQSFLRVISLRRDLGVFFMPSGVDRIMMLKIISSRYMYSMDDIIKYLE